MTTVFTFGPHAAHSDDPEPLDPFQFETAKVFALLDVFPSGVAAGDLNGDGLNDLAVAAGGCGLETGATGSVTVLINDGDWVTDGLDATLRLEVSDLCGNNCCVGAKDVIIANLNNDSHPDIAVAGVNSVSGGYVVVFYNDASNPGASFTRAPIAVGNWRYTNCLAAATLDDDADLDLAVGGLALDPNAAQITLYRNDGGAFTEVDSFEWGSLIEIDDILLGRFFGNDVLADIVAAHDSGNVLRVLQRTSGFGFVDKSLNGPSSGAGFRYSVIAGGRLNSDGLLEVIGTQINDGNDDVDVFRHDAVTGDFVHVRPDDSYDLARNTIGIDIAHLDPGSGRDAVFGLLDSTPGIGVLAGNADGTLDPSPLYTFGNGGQGSPVRVIAVDMNDDELNDIVCTNSKHTVTVLINNSSAQ